MTDDTSRPPPAKVDPETLALRARPPRAIRYKRGVVIGIAALGSAGLMGVAWIALKPQVFNRVVEASDLAQPGGQASSDTLDRMPATYGDVPKLGPPLPGDLGGPILAHERAVVGDASGATTPSPVDNEQRLATERKASRESPVMFQIAAKGGGRGGDSGAQSPSPDATGATPTSEGATGPTDRKTAFVARNDEGPTVNPHRLAVASSPHLLTAGSVIIASLLTGLNSDTPGLVTAQVTQAAYDSPTGSILLVPQGTRLIGQYDSVVAFGQRRALVIWQRIVFPDGSSLKIDNVPATDAAGYAGLSGKVDFHSWSLLRGIALSTLLGVGTQLSISGESDLVRAIRESAQQNGARAGDEIVKRNLDIAPTIRIAPGTPVRLVVHRDLVLAPWPRGGE